MSSPAREEIVLRLSDAQIEMIRRRVQRRKQAIAAATSVQEVGVIDLRNLAEDRSWFSEYPCTEENR